MGECPKPCCNALRADCEACKYGVTVEEICRVHEEDMALDSYLQPLEGCPQVCCNAIEAKCEACKAGVTVDEICRTWVVDSSDPFSAKSRPLPGCPTEQPPICCNAYNAKCEACKFGITVEEMCRVHEEDMALDSHLQPLQGCPKKPKKCCRANTLECQ